jgi:hypothetical protein
MIRLARFAAAAKGALVQIGARLDDSIPWIVVSVHSITDAG